MAAPSLPRFLAAWRTEAFFFSVAFLFGGSCMLHIFVFADATTYMNTCLLYVNSLKPSAAVQHRELLSSNRHMAWKMSIHIDTGWTHQSTSSGLPQNPPYQPHDLLALGTYVPQVAAGSTRRTRSAWARTVAKRCKR